MNMMVFHCWGHPHIRATHSTTFEFTKEGEMTVRGTCIIGVRANFQFPIHLPPVSFQKIKLMLSLEDIEEEIHAEYHASFTSPTEMVIRKSAFTSERTFAIHATKAAIDLKRAFVEKLQNATAKMTVRIVPL
ncbi:DUF371 domain-containing protein [Candidatus Woesearchaeota archaeon]|nr:DUF371 domain-containing protein [Candidatus Woesearchaeota archaeon]